VCVLLPQPAIVPSTSSPTINRSARITSQHYGRPSALSRSPGTRPTCPCRGPESARSRSTRATRRESDWPRHAKSPNPASASASARTSDRTATSPAHPTGTKASAKAKACHYHQAHHHDAGTSTPLVPKLNGAQQHAPQLDHLKAVPVHAAAVFRLHPAAGGQAAPLSRPKLRTAVRVEPPQRRQTRSVSTSPDTGEPWPQRSPQVSIRTPCLDRTRSRAAAQTGPTFSWA
jgi:hypothetical protein